MLAALIRRVVVRRTPRDLALETTTFSLSTQVPRPAERRADARILGMLPTARLISDHRQDFCRIRNISAGGLMAEGAAPFAVGERVVVELNSHQRIAGEIVWTRDGAVGVKFAEDVDLRELLAARRPVNGQTLRPPRLEVTCGATVRIDGFYHRVQVRDISLAGMKIALEVWPCVGKNVVITIESFRAVKGRIRWYREGMVGIVFDSPLRFDELAAWMAKRVEISSLKAGAWEKRGV
ncbi:PilZ domain-containing protein [Sphingomonas sp. LY54]|uniref:PilZ domain-containing protein n=1 Tax=Sphingomonas sp. LY54 TaxID=3095343 RepID=UPI002D77B93C|nr:PilZ domain-containing protein [Sphingomonas sp. LY54]WRP29152.1 PilZ domain-containing protein [Sphingomonas sp. LY54]